MEMTTLPATEKRRSLLFPRYISKRPRRELAFYRDGMVHCESRFRVTIESIEQLRATLFDYNLLLFVDSFYELPEGWLEYGIDYGEVRCNRKEQVVSLRFFGEQQRTRTVASCHGFNFASCSYQMLDTLRTWFELVDLEPCSSLAGAGFSLLQRTWLYQFGDGWIYHRHNRPMQGYCDRMQLHRNGARSDVLSTDIYPWGYVVDMKDAYGAACRKPLPTGLCSYAGSHVNFKRIFWGQATIMIRERLPLGLFPVKGLQETISYPTQPGTYVTWLWSNQVHLCQTYGLSVKMDHCFEWEETTTEPALFPLLLSYHRENVTDETLKGLCKGALVGGLGRLGMDVWSYSLVRDGDLERGDVPASVKGIAYDYWIHAERDYKPQSMPHWYGYILALIQEALTLEALKWVLQGLQDRTPYLLGTNTDAVILGPQADISSYPPKGTPDLEPGSWSVERIEEIQIPALRHLLGQGVDIRPGVAKEGRV